MVAENVKLVVLFFYRYNINILRLNCTTSRRGKHMATAKHCSLFSVHSIPVLSLLKQQLPDTRFPEPHYADMHFFCITHAYCLHR